MGKLRTFDGKEWIDLAIPGPKGDRGEPGPTGRAIFGGVGAPGKDGSPDTPEQVRDKLETLEGDERLKATAISGLEPLLADVETLKKRPIQTPAKSYAIHTKDASAQCDGATTSFTVGGSHFGIIGVFSTEFPQIYRPIIDYTETRTGITLTAQVSAPASGQTLVIQYLK